MDKEAILKRVFLQYVKDHPDYNFYAWSEQDKEALEICYLAMDEYSAPFKKALNGLIEMYKMDYPTTVHYMFRPEYLFAVEVMKGEVIESDYWKQLAESAAAVLGLLGISETFSALNIKDSPEFRDSIIKWQELKKKASSGNQIPDQTEK